jgi:hypothetical protein
MNCFDRGGGPEGGIAEGGEIFGDGPIAPARARRSPLSICRRSATTVISPLSAAIPRPGPDRWIVILRAWELGFDEADRAGEIFPSKTPAIVKAQASHLK